MSEVKSTDITYFKEWLKKLNEDIIRFTQTLPAYKFLTAVSQLVSRICHPSKQVWELLKGKDLLNWRLRNVLISTVMLSCYRHAIFIIVIEFSSFIDIMLFVEMEVIWVMEEHEATETKTS